MSMRRRLGFLLAAVLGAAVVVLPAIATSETGPTIEATNKAGGGIYKEETHAWLPSAVAVSAPGVVPFANTSGTVEHGIVWSAGPATPACEGGVPINRGSTLWKGSCTFSQAGTYTFYCYVHPTEMKGTITVSPSGTTTITTQTPPTSPGGAGTTPPITTPEPSPLESPLAGNGSTALKVASKQRGKSVHGSLDVSPAGVGGRLEVDLLAKRASLASVGHPPPVRVGRTVRTALQAGRVPFSAPLTTRAKNALRRHGRLPLSVKVIVKPASGSAVTVTRAVVLHP
jgi:plastocyanin